MGESTGILEMCEMLIKNLKGVLRKSKDPEIKAKIKAYIEGFEESRKQLLDAQNL